MSLLVPRPHYAPFRSGSTPAGTRIVGAIAPRRTAGIRRLTRATDPSLAPMIPLCQPSRPRRAPGTRSCRKGSSPPPVLGQILVTLLQELAAATERSARAGGGVRRASLWLEERLKRP